VISNGPIRLMPLWPAIRPLITIHGLTPVRLHRPHVLLSQKRRHQLAVGGDHLIDQVVDPGQRECRGRVGVHVGSVVDVTGILLQHRTYDDIRRHHTQLSLCPRGQPKIHPETWKVSYHPNRAYSTIARKFSGYFRGDTLQLAPTT
jgi:hypothetical protein